MIDRTQLEAILANAPKLKIGLIGDLFLDRYLEISATLHETSIETGLEAYQVERVRNVAGALGTIINNLVALGVGTVLPVSVIGRDGLGFDLLQCLQPVAQVDTSHIIQCEDRLTPTYTKPLKPTEDGQWVELNRLDIRSRQPMSAATIDQTCNRLETLFATVDGWIVLDQIPQPDMGVIHHQVRSKLKKLAQNLPDKLVYIDSRSQIGRFDFGILKGNVHELTAAAGLQAAPSLQTARQAALKLGAQTEQPLFCTLGQQGLLVAEPNGKATVVPAVPVEGPIDIVGAGDSATSGLVISLLGGATPVQAATVANLVASITIQQIGTTGTASPDQVLARWDAAHHHFSSGGTSP